MCVMWSRWQSTCTRYFWEGLSTTTTGRLGQDSVLQRGASKCTTGTHLMSSPSSISVASSAKPNLRIFFSTGLSKLLLSFKAYSIPNTSNTIPVKMLKHTRDEDEHLCRRKFVAIEISTMNLIFFFFDFHEKNFLIGNILHVALTSSAQEPQ